MSRKLIPSVASLVVLVGLVLVAASVAVLLARTAPVIQPDGPNPLAAPVVEGGYMQNGPLVQLVPHTYFIHGQPAVVDYYHVEPFDFAKSNGAWRVMVFLTIDPPVERKPQLPMQPKPWTLNEDPESNNAYFVHQLVAALSTLRDTQVWLVRMNHVSTMMGGPASMPEGPNYIWGASTVPCGAPRYDLRANCFSKFLYAGAYPGRQGFYYWPQHNWFWKTFHELQNRCPSEQPGHAVIFLDPEGRIFYNFADICPLGAGLANPGTPSLRGALAAFNAARVHEGYSPILKLITPTPGPSLSAWLAGVWGHPRGATHDAPL